MTSSAGVGGGLLSIIGARDPRQLQTTSANQTRVNSSRPLIIFRNTTLSPTYMILCPIQAPFMLIKRKNVTYRRVAKSLKEL